MSGILAIVGRPNVGKSALFNRIAGKRISIVHDEPGVTRDRISAEVEWGGRPFTLVDTGGIGLLRREKAEDVIVKAAFEQVEIAIDSAHAIILTVNVQEGVAPLDREVASRLRAAGKPVLVAVNKVDHGRLEDAAAEFAELGFERIFPVSAIHGVGIEELMKAGLELLPAEGQTEAAVETEPGGAEPEEATAPLKLVIIGRPNVGKSSIINTLTQSERVVVSPIPGTTRDAVDVPFEVETEGRRESYILIDTAGVRQEKRIDSRIEYFSLTRTEQSIGRCDIAIMVLDAEAGVTAQDKKVAGKIVEERKACIVIVNKWDLVGEEVAEARKEERQRRLKQTVARAGGEKPRTTLAEFGQWVQKQLFFVDYAPVIFTSAKTGYHLDRLLEAVRYVAAQMRQKVPTALLNRALQEAIERRQPISATGQRLKFFYATQTGQSPPSFLLFVNRDELFSEPYEKYLAGELRKAFGYEGCPLILKPRPRPKTVESVRKKKPAKQKARGGGKRGGRDKRPG